MVTMTSSEDPISITENFVQPSDSELVSENRGHVQSPCRILVVDSNKVWRVIAMKVLRHLNVEIFESDGPEEALMAALKYQPDIIIVDLDHPEQDAAEGIQKLRTEALLSETPIIITSEKIDRAMVSRLARAQVQFALLKPYDEADLVSRVERLMSPDKTREPAEAAKGQS